MPPRNSLAPFGVDTPALRPVATATDTYMRPAAGSGLAQLAGALGSLAPGLRQIGNEVNQRDADAQMAQGEAWASSQADSQDMWAGAIQAGTIAPAQSPWFRLAANKKLGQVAADRFNVQLQQNLAKLGDGATPDAFESAVAGARKDFLNTVVGKSAGNLQFMQGFDGIADQHVARARGTFAMENAKQFELQASDAYFNAGHAIGRKAVEAGQSTPEIAKMLNDESSAWAGVNPAATRPGQISGSKLSQLNAQIVFSLMRSTRNVKLATDLASQIKDGNGVLLDSAEFQAKLESESDHVTELARQDENDAEVKQQRAEKDATSAAEEVVYQRWQKGGSIDTADIEQSLKQAGVKDPHVTAVKLIDKMPEMDPKYFVGFRSQIARGQFPAQADLDTAARGHRISSGQYNSLVSDITEAQRAERALALQGMATTESIWTHPAVKAIEDNIRAAAKTKAKVDPLTGNIISYNGFTDNDVQQSVFQAKLFMADWLGKNWSKYGSGDEPMRQAGIAWRGFAAQNHVITTDEAGFGKPVLPSDPGVASDIQKNQVKQGKVTPPKPNESHQPKPSTDFSKAEIQTMRNDFAQWNRMSADQRTKWISDPRHRAILNQLGQPGLADIGNSLAAAEKAAR